MSGVPTNNERMRFKRSFALFVVALLLGGAAVPAGAAGGMKSLGSDPSGDAPPALDLTSLKAGRSGNNLEIHIGIANMLPVIGGYPQLPGIQWAFDVKARTFIAEAFVAGRKPAFVLFEDKGDSFEQLGTLEGTYSDGVIKMLVPLELIDARSGMKVTGAGANDVDAHVHLGPQTYVADTLTTTKSLILP